MATTPDYINYIVRDYNLGKAMRQRIWLMPNRRRTVSVDANAEGMPVTDYAQESGGKFWNESWLGGSRPKFSREKRWQRLPSSS
jgi:hypothetical protein